VRIEGCASASPEGSENRVRAAIRRSRLLPLGLAAAALAGCASSAADSSVGAVSTLATAASNAVGSANDAVATLVGADSKTGPALQREQMEKQAGRAHFANPQLIAGRTGLQTTRTEFGARRDLLVSSPFVAARNQFRGQHAVPSSGPVLGPAVGDSATSLAILAAAGGGVPLPLWQPVLARLLPGFGY